MGDYAILWKVWYMVFISCNDPTLSQMCTVSEQQQFERHWPARIDIDFYRLFWWLDCMLCVGFGFGLDLCCAHKIIISLLDNSSACLFI